MHYLITHFLLDVARMTVSVFILAYARTMLDALTSCDLPHVRPNDTLVPPDAFAAVRRRAYCAHGACLIFTSGRINNGCAGECLGGF